MAEPFGDDVVGILVDPVGRTGSPQVRRPGDRPRENQFFPFYCLLVSLGENLEEFGTEMSSGIRVPHCFV